MILRDIAAALAAANLTVIGTISALNTALTQVTPPPAPGEQADREGETGGGAAHVAGTG